MFANEATTQSKTIVSEKSHEKEPTEFSNRRDEEDVYQDHGIGRRGVFAAANDLNGGRAAEGCGDTGVEGRREGGHGVA